MLDVNIGGLVVEVGVVRGVVPSEQVALSQVSNLDELVGKDLEITVIEVDPNQNRLICSQKTSLTEEVKQTLSAIKEGEIVKGKVAAVLPFGIFVSLDNGVEGLVHVSEISWEKQEDPNSLYKIDDPIEAKVISVESGTGRVNLSIRQLAKDPFVEKAKDLQPDDVVKGKVTKITSMGVFVELESGVEGLIKSSSLGEDNKYEMDQEATFLVDTIDTQKRRIYLAPFVTSTKDLIYK